MKPRMFEFRLSGVRGIPRVLLLGLIALVVGGVIALLIMVGMAVVVAGLAVSAVAALWYAVRRALLPGSAAQVSETHWQRESHTADVSRIDVLEAEVEVLPIEEKRPDAP